MADKKRNAKLSKEEIKKYLKSGGERPIKIIKGRLVWRKGEMDNAKH